MKYLDTLKKERSLDRVIFLAGMVLAFIGFLIPTVYVKQVTAPVVDNTVEETEEDYSSTSEAYAATESDDDESEASAEAVYILKETTKDFVLDKNYDNVLDKNGKPVVETTVTYSYISDFELEDGQKPETKLLNIFGICGAYNVSPYAYNATFLVIMWLCSIAGIVLFFITKSLIGDIVVVLIGLGFAIASVITIPLTFHVAPVVGYMSVGGYVVLAGWIASIVGSVLGAAHIQHPQLVKEI